MDRLKLEGFEITLELLINMTWVEGEVLNLPLPGFLKINLCDGSHNGHFEHNAEAFALPQKKSTT